MVTCLPSSSRNFQFWVQVSFPITARKQLSWTRRANKSLASLPPKWYLHAFKKADAFQTQRFNVIRMRKTVKISCPKLVLFSTRHFLSIVSILALRAIGVGFPLIGEELGGRVIFPFYMWVDCVVDVCRYEQSDFSRAVGGCWPIRSSFSTPTFTHSFKFAGLYYRLCVYSCLLTMSCNWEEKSVDIERLKLFGANRKRRWVLYFFNLIFSSILSWITQLIQFSYSKKFRYTSISDQIPKSIKDTVKIKRLGMEIQPRVKAHV